MRVPNLTFARHKQCVKLVRIRSFSGPNAGKYELKNPQTPTPLKQ